METCVEIAIIETGNSITSVYRVSIFEALTRKRIHRVLIGDSMTMLGRFANVIWNGTATQIDLRDFLS